MDFPPAWPDTRGPGDKRPAARLDGVPNGPSDWSHVGIRLARVPSERKLTFSCEIKGTSDDQPIMVNAFAYDKTKKLIKNWSKSMYLTRDSWKAFRDEYIVPPESASFTLWVIDAVQMCCYVSSPSLTAAEAESGAEELAAGPEIIHAHEELTLKPSDATGVVTFPVPGLYREQIPVTFAVSASPESALLSYHLRQREDGRNWLCEATLKSPSAPANIHWDALVLVKPRTEQALEKVMPASNSESEPWTRSTACVQSDDPAIKAKANSIGTSTDDVDTYARKVIEFTSKNKGTGAKFDSLDARLALDCGGSCTSRANLAAALLRAHGIPARTVSHLPTWAGQLYEHWLVEYWHPGKGWIWLESTLGIFQPKPTTLVVLNEANPEDEDKAFDANQLRHVMPGAPYLSCILISTELTADSKRDYNDKNFAKAQGQINGSATELAALYQSAEAAYDKIIQRKSSAKQEEQLAKAITAAAHNGEAKAVIAALGGELGTYNAVSAGNAPKTRGSTAQSPEQKKSAAKTSDREELALLAQMEASRTKNGNTHRQTMQAMWSVSQYYLKTRKFAQAENMLRYLNDAALQNSKNAPYSNADIARAYAQAVTGMRAIDRGHVPPTNASREPDLKAGISNTRVTAVGGRWFLAGSARDSYEIGRDEADYIKTKFDTADGFGTIMRELNPQPYLGKRIRFSAKIKTANAERAQLWLRVDQPDGNRQLDNSQNRPTTGTTGWNRCDCVMDVPSGSSKIAFGLILSGTGKAWIEDATIEEVGTNVSTTTMY